MEPVIELHHWNAYQFSQFEHRLIGYIKTPTSTVCTVTAPIVGVTVETKTVNTADGKVYAPLDIIDPAQKMDMMYSLGRWVDLNMKNQPRESTAVIVEALEALEVLEGTKE